MKQSVCENMPTLGVVNKLDFVNRNEGKVSVSGYTSHRHGFDRANEKARFWRDNFFLARNKRALMTALYLANSVVNFSG